MVNISDLEKVRKATGIYSEYKEVFDCIRDIGVRAEAAFKIIIGDTRKLTLGDKKKLYIINSLNIFEDMKDEIKKLMQTVGEFRNYANHNHIYKFDDLKKQAIETKLKNDYIEANKSLDKIYEYVFVDYFSKANYANSLELLGMFSLFPPIFRFNILEKYDRVLNDTVKGYKELLEIIEKQKLLKEADFNQKLVFAIVDILFQLDNIYRGVDCNKGLNNVRSLSLIDVIYSNDFVYSYQKNEKNLAMECFLNPSVYGFYNKFKHLLVFNNKKILNYKKFNDFKKAFDKEINKRHEYYKQIVLELDEDLKTAVEYLLEFNIIRQRVLLDKLFLAKMKAEGVDVAIDFISSRIDLDEIYDFESIKHGLKNNEAIKQHYGEIKNMQDYFIGKIKRVNNNIQNQGGLPYETLEKAKKAFEKHVNDHDLNNHYTKYLSMIMKEAYDRIVSDSKPVKDLSKYFAG